MTAPQDKPARETFTAGERPISAIVADLSKPIPDRYLETRKQGGTEIRYIPWHVATRFLDHYAPGWTYEIRLIDRTDLRLALVVRLTIPALDGNVFRDATGNEELSMKGYGDVYSNSESMALRRAAAKFGLGRSLYDKSAS